MAEWLRGVDAPAVLRVFNLAAVLGFALAMLGQGLLRLRKKGGRLAAGLEKATAAARQTQWLLVGALTLFALFIRLFAIGRYPMGFNQDEASIAYDALCMARYGTDRYGYPMPAYLTAWDSGQNALYMYLLIPLYRLFGFSVFITRLPQAVLGGLAVPLLFLVLKKATGPRAAIIGAALLAVCPWHLMASRWALEVYPLIPVLLAAVLCLLHTESRPWLWLPAFGLFALALYCYITAAIFLAVFMALAFVYLLCFRRIRWRWFLPGAALGLVLALPLLLLILVNNGLLPEIRTGFLSVPLMPGYRGGEVGADMAANARALPGYFLLQRPAWSNNLYDAVDVFGIVYLFSTPFALWGLGWLCRRFGKAVRAKTFAPEGLLLFWLLGALATSLLVFPQTLNRSMTLALAYVMLTALGLAAATRRFSALAPAALAGYAGAFCLFFVAYFFSYAPDIGQRFYDSLPQALEKADAVAEGRDILVPATVNPTLGAGSAWPLVCLGRELSPEEFRAQFQTARKEAEYGQQVNVGNTYLLAAEFAGPAPYGTGVVYVLFNHLDPVEEYAALGFETETFRNHTVAWWPGEQAAPPPT